MRTVELIPMFKIVWRGRTEIVSREEAEGLRLQLSAVLFSGQSEEPVTMNWVVATVATRFDLTVTGLLSKRRTERVAWPRQIAMHLCRQLTDHSLHEVGAFFSKDHGTVLHACRLVEFRRQHDKKLNELVQSMADQIVSRSATQPVTQPKELAA